jgi:hypothetical protein
MRTNPNPFYVEGVKLAYEDYMGALPPEYLQAVDYGAQQSPDTAKHIRTALQSLGGGVLGGTGGAALGAGLGYSGGHLAQLLGLDVDDDDIRKATTYGGLLGGGAGAAAGAAGGGLFPKGDI